MKIPSLESIHYSYWLMQTIAMLATAMFVPGLKLTNPLGALLMVVALAFVNTHIWDAALFFELPDSFTSRTLTLLFANGVVFWVLVKLLPWIEINGILAAFIAPIVFTAFNIGVRHHLRSAPGGRTGMGVGRA